MHPLGADNTRTCRDSRIRRKRQTPRPSPRLLSRTAIPQASPYAAILSIPRCFSGSDARKRMINLFAVSCGIVGARLQFLDVAPNVRKFCADFSETLSRLVPNIIKLLAKRSQLLIRRRKLILCPHLSPDIANIILPRHVFDDVSEHLPNFFERRFLCLHKQPLYHTQ